MLSSFFDAIYCINLIERKDRYELSKKVFKKFNIPVRYYQPNRHKNGDQGCFNSHVAICKEAMENKYNRIIIFEDDIIETSSLNKESLKYVVSTLKKIKNWNIFYLGCFPDIRYRSFSTQYKNIYRMRAYGAHAYAINTNMIRVIAGLKWEGRSYDSYLMDSYHYAYMPRLFDQRAISSDIPRGINAINNFGSIKKLFLNLNDWYSVNVQYGVYEVLFWILLFIGIFYSLKCAIKKEI